MAARTPGGISTCRVIQSSGVIIAFFSSAGLCRGSAFITFHSGAGGGTGAQLRVPLSGTERELGRERPRLAQCGRRAVGARLPTLIARSATATSSCLRHPNAACRPRRPHRLRDAHGGLVLAGELRLSGHALPRRAAHCDAPRCAGARGDARLLWPIARSLISVVGEGIRRILKVWTSSV
jgi:hypothetical protein